MLPFRFYPRIPIDAFIESLPIQYPFHLHGAERLKLAQTIRSLIKAEAGPPGVRRSGQCSCYDNAAFPFEISAHPVDHSIFGATAYILRGETTVAYTGDFRLHGKNGDSTRDFVSRAKEASVLITEGTRAGPTEGEKTSERTVCEACRESVESSSGLVIADFSPRNFERLESFQEIARKTGRELVAMAKDVYMLHNLQCINGSCMTDGLKIYSEVMDKSKRKWEQEVVQPLYGDQYVDHKAIRDNPDN